METPLTPLERQSLANHVQSQLVSVGHGYRNSKGQVLKTFYPRVIISKTNRRVITLYPARGC